MAVEIVLSVLTETPGKVHDIIQTEREISDKTSGDGSEEMPYVAAAAHVFFVRYCQATSISPANPSDVKWATPILVLGDGWIVKSWVNPLGAKHLFVVSPKQKVYASTWAWGPLRHKVNLLEKTLLQYFTPDMVTPPMPTERASSAGISGDGSEEMPEAVTVVHVFFVRYCQAMRISPANPSDVKWATPILVLGSGWTVKSWVNPLGAKHLFIVSPKQHVYASTWAWGPVRHKVDLLEKELLDNFAPDVLISPISTLSQDSPGIAPASSSTKYIDSKKR
ncbi:MAG: hypothetical protein IGR80_14370 [Synechococcales cyanobacterium K44_A2020_017]|nr:hypothetical protein [Synechococcales cyanobacterium K44_A2020_017]